MTTSHITFLLYLLTAYLFGYYSSNHTNILYDDYYVKIIVPWNSRYIYTYDKDQQLLTVYNTEPSKENKANANNYQLVYMLSLKFNIEWVNVYDVDIPWEWNKPELYVLSSKWVNKIPLYEYLEAMN